MTPTFVIGHWSLVIGAGSAGRCRIINRIRAPLAGFVLAGMLTAGLPVRGADVLRPRGSGPAYDLIGKVPVMHAGRVKPLDTVAREEVKQIYGRETIKLHDPGEEVEKILGNDSSRAAKPEKWRVEKWGPVGAFIEWTTRPEFWDEQPFILVDYLPLKRLILAETIQKPLQAIADKTTTPAAEKTQLQKLAGEQELTSAALASFLHGSRLPIEDRQTIAELAAKLSEASRWMAPRELEQARITAGGQTLPFLDWASELQEQQRKFSNNPQSVARPTELERRAVEVASRLSTYQAYSGERLRSNDVILIMPRPSSAQYLADSARTIKKAREGANPRDLPLFQQDELQAISTFWNDVPRDDRRDPTQDPAFDQRYAAWLRDNSAWVPLKVLLRSKPEELTAAGYPETQMRAFLDAYHELEQAESSSPGLVGESTAERFLSATRALGEAVNPSKYPTVAMVERETHFNSMNPFWQAPYAYGAALALLALSLGFVSVRGARTFSQLLGSTIYRFGLTALAVGIALEIYGFYLRVAITGWAPVTNMYETVIWVALVAATLSFIFEMIYRKVFFALAGSGVALLGTLTAANVALLDPSIKSLQPVLRSNLWLTIHVLTEVSSYAAFGLAWMLGLIATWFYLTATYRRSPPLGKLALPLVPGLPLLAVGGLGVAASYGMLGPQWSISQAFSQSSSQAAAGIDPLFYACAVMALVGEWLSLAGVIAVGGEVLNRLTVKRLAAREVPADSTTPPLDQVGRRSATEVTAAERRSTDGGAAGVGAAPRAQVTPDARALAMQRTAGIVKPLGNFIYRTMQVGVLLIAAGTILGGVWADYSWGRFWGWDPKEVWALITLLVYLIPLHGRFAGWISSFGLVAASVACFLSVVMAWYGVNFVLGVGLHSYGFVEGGSQGIMSVIIMGVLSLPLAAGWRRHLGQRS
jgi:ABC-type transport system involved in cytochrome c biogenesis permease subunit